MDHDCSNLLDLWSWNTKKIYVIAIHNFLSEILHTLPFASVILQKFHCWACAPGASPCVGSFPLSALRLHTKYCQRMTFFYRNLDRLLPHCLLRQFRCLNHLSSLFRRHLPEVAAQWRPIKFKDTFSSHKFSLFFPESKAQKMKTF